MRYQKHLLAAVIGGGGIAVLAALASTMTTPGTVAAYATALLIVSGLTASLLSCHILTVIAEDEQTEFELREQLSRG